MQTKLIPHRLLMIIAHPDDETFLGIGLLEANRRAGGSNAVFCATCGEKGSSHLKRKVTPAQLKQIRLKELRSVTRAIPGTKLITSNCADGGLHLTRQKLWREVVKAAKTIKPDLIVSFGSDGITGHIDHITAGAASQRLAKQLRLPLWVFTYPEKYHQKMPTLLKGRRVNPHYRTVTKYHQAKIHIRVNPVWKLRMLRRHASQVSHVNPYHPVPVSIAKHFLANEYFG